MHKLTLEKLEDKLLLTGNVECCGCGCPCCVATMTEEEPLTVIELVVEEVVETPVTETLVAEIPVVVEEPVVVIEESVIEEEPVMIVAETPTGDPAPVTEPVTAGASIGPTNTYTEVLTSEDIFIFRGEERPTPSPVTTEQWAYENSQGGKITWYIYGVDLTGGGLQTLGKVEEMMFNFSEFTSFGIGPYVTIYTAPQFGGDNAGSFYRSRINYVGDYSYVDPATDDVVVASAEIGETTPNFRETIDGVTYVDIGLNYEAFSSAGPQKNTEIVSFIVISTSSGQLQGVENWAMSNAQINFRNDTYQYQFRTIGEDSPNISDDPNWDVVNTDLLQYAATIKPNAPGLPQPLEAASFILNDVSKEVTGMRVYQDRTGKLVNPLEVPTTSNPQQLLELLNNRIVYKEDVVYFETTPESAGDTYIFTYIPWNAISQPTLPELEMSVDLAGVL